MASEIAKISLRVLSISGAILELYHSISGVDDTNLNYCMAKTFSNKLVLLGLVQNEKCSRTVGT